MKKGVFRRVKSIKSQITIFVIVAILLVIIVSSVAFLTYSAKKGWEIIPGLTLSVSDAAENLKTQRDKCTNDLSIDGLDLYGLNEAKVKEYLYSKFSDCVNPIINSYKKQFEIEANLNSIDVKINSDEIRIDIDFPITIKKGDSVQKIEKQSLIFQRTITKLLNHDSNCAVTNDAALVSFDEKFKIVILRGTKATKETGECLENITIRLEDPVAYGNSRTTSLTSIIYQPGPFGARFDNYASLESKYTSKDYNDYITSVLALNQYVILENQLKLWLYDKSSNNFYVYPSQNGLENNVDVVKKIITAKVNQFYGSKLAASSECGIDKATSIESFDRRVVLEIPNGVIAKKENGDCLDKISIEIKPKTSKVVNFGYSDYDLLPTNAQFSPSINYIYKYSKAEIQNPVFLYGWKNWQNLINDTWVSPVADEAPLVKLLSPANNQRSENKSLTFVFSVIDDYQQYLNCSLYIDGILKNSIIAKNSESGNLSAVLEEGYYYWRVECNDGNSDGVSESRNIAVGNASTLGFTGFVIKNFLEATGKAITGKVIALTGFASSSSNTGLKKRSERDLKIAYYNEADGVYRPWPTRIDTQKKTITAKITHLSFEIPAQGCDDEAYAKYMNVNTVPLAINFVSPWDCTDASLTGTGNFQEYTIVRGDSCLNEDEMAVELTPVISDGDTASALENAGVEPSTAAGDHLFRIETLTNTDGQTSDRGSYCAWADVYLRVKGIGAYGWGDKISSDEYYANAMGATTCIDSSGQESVSYMGECCDNSNDACGEDLCNRCLKEVQNAGDAGKGRLNGCVRGNACGGGEEAAAEESGVVSNETLAGTAISGSQVAATNEYTLREIAKINNFLTEMAIVNDTIYVGMYGDPENGHYAQPPFTTWNSIRVSSGDESLAAFNLNNRSYFFSEGGVVFADGKKCYDMNSYYGLGAEYFNGIYILSLNRKTDSGGYTSGVQFYNCPCSDGITCTKWKSPSGFTFVFGLKEYNGLLYFGGIGGSDMNTKLYYYDSSGSMKSIKIPGISAGGDSLDSHFIDQMAVFDGKLFLGVENGVKIFSYDGTSIKQELNMGLDRMGGFAVYDNKLFASATNMGGNTEIYARTNDSAGAVWTKVFSKKQMSKYGSGDKMTTGYMAVYGDKLYIDEDTPNHARSGPGYILEISKNINLTASNITSNNSASNNTNYTA